MEEKRPYQDEPDKRLTKHGSKNVSIGSQVVAAARSASQNLSEASDRKRDLSSLEEGVGRLPGRCRIANGGKGQAFGP